MYADTTSNYRTWTTSTDYAGNALATGWNLIFVDISTGGSASGSGWTYTALSRYQEIFVTTSSAAQTYSAILLDGIWFSHGAISDFGTIGLQFTGFNNSTKHDFIFDSANTRHDGPLTLDATVAANYTAGIGNADQTRFLRSTMEWTNNGAIGFESDFSSGTISTEQEVRLLKQFRESLSGNLGAFVDLYTPQVYKVTAVGGSTIDVDDPANTSANLLNGESVHIFETIRNAGEITFALRATRAMTGNASHSTGTTTLTLTTTSIAVGDYVVKQHLAVAASLVGKSSDESYSSMSYDTTPNGAQLIDQGRAIPNPGNLYASWALGDFNETLALRDRSGNGRNLTKVGSPNLADSFQRGRYSGTSFSTSNYLRMSGSTIATLNSNAFLVQTSLWFYFDASNANDRALLITGHDQTGGGQGSIIYIPSTQVFVTSLFFNGGGSTSSVNSGTLTPGTWNHILVQTKSGVNQNIYLNGVLNSTTAGTAGANGTSQSAVYVGVWSNSSTLDGGLQYGASGLKIADVHIWRDGALLTQAQVNQLYNAGAPVPTGFFPVCRNELALTGQSGQKLSMRARMSRSTTAVNPQILDLGIIKTS